jgi:hypothetical protein
MEKALPELLGVGEKKQRRKKEQHKKPKEKIFMFMLL